MLAASQVPRVSFKRKLLYKKEARIWLYDDQLKRALLPNETHLIRETFKDESIYDKWRACCRHAVDCCLDNWKHLPTTTNSLGQLVDRYPRTQCPATWDGLTCWQNSPAGQLAWRECPRHVYFLSFEPACTGHVSKQCFANASWFIRNDHEWSDYSHCAVLPVSIVTSATRAALAKRRASQAGRKSVGRPNWASSPGQLPTAKMDLVACLLGAPVSSGSLAVELILN